MIGAVLIAAMQMAAPAASRPAPPPVSSAIPPAASATTRATATPPPRFSILAQACPRAVGSDVVVCADDATTSPRLPLPDDAPPTPGYVKPDSGDYRDNQGDRGSCAAVQGGCQVGFGPPIMPVVAAAARGIGNALKDRREARARQRDGDRRVAIALDAPPVAGHLEH